MVDWFFVAGLFASAIVIILDPWLKGNTFRNLIIICIGYICFSGVICIAYHIANAIY